MLVYLNRSNIFGKKQARQRLENTPLMNLASSGGAPPTGEMDSTEKDNTHPTPTWRIIRIILSSIFPVIFIIVEIGFWCHDRTSKIDDLVCLQRDC